MSVGAAGVLAPAWRGACLHSLGRCTCVLHPLALFVALTPPCPPLPAPQVSPDCVLTISGERSTENRSGSEEEGTLRVERSFGTFTRRLRLPDGVDVEGESRRAELRGQ